MVFEADKGWNKVMQGKKIGENMTLDTGSILCFKKMSDIDDPDFIA